jgi:hypothetical protein
LHEIRARHVYASLLTRECFEAYVAIRNPIGPTKRQEADIKDKEADIRNEADWLLCGVLSSEPE